MDNLREVISNILSYFENNDFFEQYYEKNFYYGEVSINYENLLTLSDINNFFSRNDLQLPFIRMAKDGNPVPYEEYLLDISAANGFDRIINVDKVLSKYHNGTTIILNAGQLIFNNLRKLCSKLEDFFNFRINANIYITPKNNQGFTPHVDGHDVIILQIEGEKDWEIYRPIQSLPNSSQAGDLNAEIRNGKELKHLKSIKLSKGNFMYIPRGFIHEAKCSNEHSIHITIGLFPLLWTNLVSKYLEKVVESTLPNSSLPTWNTKDNISDYQSKVDILAKEISEINISSILNKGAIEKENKAIKLQNNKNRFYDIIKSPNIDLNTKVKIRHGVVYNITQSDSYISLGFYEKTVNLPLLLHSTLDFILEHDTFFINELPNEYDDNSKILLIQKLVSEGLLTIVG